MATTQRDYYEVLGVSRGADDGEIKRAFRRLARELHPDVSDAPDAQERFREVVEAYEVLSKRETRELYDRFGHAGVRGEIELVEAATGTRREVPFPVAVACRTCGGSGAAPGTNPVSCPT